MSFEPTNEQMTAHFLELEWALDRIERSSTHYQALDLERSASSEEIKLAYQQHMSLLNPSSSVHTSLPNNVQARIREAVDSLLKSYMVLSNFGKKVEYDNSLTRRTTAPIAVDIPTAIRQNPLTVNPNSNGAAASHINQPAPKSIEQEAISIKHTSMHNAVFTKPAHEAAGGDRRRHKRFALTVPTYVIGYDESRGRWNEIAQTLNVSMGGAALRMERDVRVGMILYLMLPLPLKLRQYGYTEASYNVYVIVRRAEPTEDQRRIVRVEFLGSSPPPGYLDKPWATFKTKS